MTLARGWIKKTILITVRTYPVPSRKSVEVSCTAGITDDGEWIRLFPFPWRQLGPAKQPRKYDYIEANVARAPSDRRPESHNIDIESIRILPESVPPDGDWRARKDKIFPLKSPSLCSLQRTRDADKEPTLGIFQPKTIVGLRIEKTDAEWSETELGRLRQTHMFDNSPREELEKIPYTFYYTFTCDDPDCGTHTLSCTDWEMSQSYRKWRRRYGKDWEDKFRNRYEKEMIEKYDTHFFVGTMRTHPDSWIIVGLFYPPKQRNLPLW